MSVKAALLTFLAIQSASAINISTTPALSEAQIIGISVGSVAGAAAIGGAIAGGVIANQPPPPKGPSAQLKVAGLPEDNTTNTTAPPETSSGSLGGNGVLWLALGLILISACCLGAVVYFVMGKKKTTRKVKAYEPVPVEAPAPEPVAPMLAPVTTAYSYAAPAFSYAPAPAYAPMVAAPVVYEAPTYMTPTLGYGTATSYAAPTTVL